ncbi:MAG: dihydrodipicolinate synthase family protein [Deltaproteobacteria bacterium]|nr:dihydrodipicolinate synthase family protein [Deltaproteobacteria bacterium]
MTNSPSLFRGLFIPHVTPFSDDGTLDLESLERLTKYQLSIEGVAGLVSCARIGEGPVLSVEEKRRVYETAGKVARKAGRLHIATIAPQSTDEAIDLIRNLEPLPVDAVMIFPPLLFAWGKVGGDLKVGFFEDVTRETNLPLVLFQVPVKSYWYDVETICRIAKLEKVVAYKEASFDIELFGRTIQALRRQNATMNVLTGNDRFVAQSYALGASGALIGIANVATEKWGGMDIAGRAGDFDKAMGIQRELEAVKELVFSEPIVEAVARIKVVLQHERLIKSSRVRRPQMGVSEIEHKQLLDSYRALKENEFRGGPESTESRPLQRIV